MATVNMVTEMTPVADRERMADRVFTIAAMVGGVGGAIAGGALDMLAGIGSGAIGAIVGSCLFAAVGQVVALPLLLARRDK